MIILTVRTNKPVAKIGLYDNEKQLAYETWEAHRQLAETIHEKIEDILDKTDKKMTDLQGIAAFEGPGSFTGLRIGLSVANALAYGLDIPIVSASGENWREQGIKQLLTGGNDRLAMPRYGSPAHITQPRR
jgi:tRNA threonylcarbamoyladenosine biosynthesis protein TsaB